MAAITVIGGGLAGLVAAIECAEAGLDVELLEARSRLGGRGTSSPGPYKVALGPHAVYTGGSLWSWVQARPLDVRFVRGPGLTGGGTTFRLRHRGARRRTPPLALVRAMRLLRRPAPPDRSLSSWIAEEAGPETARMVSSLCGVLTFDHDPGRLSAPFLAERIKRILLGVPPVTRYPVGGWRCLVEALGRHATSVGVRIETNAKVDALPGTPVIVAVEPRAARELLGDPTLDGHGTSTALLDVAFGGTWKPTFNLTDLDDACFAEAFTAADPSLAPAGEVLVQGLAGMKPGETLDEAVVRIEGLLDCGWPGWRERETWRRRSAVSEASGALDEPGRTWRDRTPVAYAEGVWLAGDWVAAPGHLSEVSVASGVEAARLAAAALRRGAPAAPRRLRPA